MPTMCGDGGGFGTATRSHLRRQDCTLWRVLLLLHGWLLVKKSGCGMARVAWSEVCHQRGCPCGAGGLNTRWDLQVTLRE